ncbi:YqaJ viral recombinase family protein [Hafnia alvei]|nr:YqaJ viral recombinase family protein [Hafnia alvei]MBI0275408.1 YqaJ viral recombinase family protein [Hafnia alvei]PNK98598.1 hypothetical protein CEQ28_013890 [Hafnia alvei]
MSLYDELISKSRQDLFGYAEALGLSFSGNAPQSEIANSIVRHMDAFRETRSSMVEQENIYFKDGEESSYYTGVSPYDMTGETFAAGKIEAAGLSDALDWAMNNQGLDPVVSKIFGSAKTAGLDMHSLAGQVSSSSYGYTPSSSEINMLANMFSQFASPDSANTDVMGKLAGHDNADLYNEFMIGDGMDVAMGLSQVASKYLNKSAYKTDKAYQHDLDKVTANLSHVLPTQLKEIEIQIAQQKAAGKDSFTSYYDALPMFGDSSIVGNVRHPMPALNAMGGAFNPDWELDSSLKPWQRNPDKQKYDPLASMIGQAVPSRYLPNKQENPAWLVAMEERAGVRELTKSIATVYGISGAARNDGISTGLSPNKYQPYEAGEIRDELARRGVMDEPDYITGTHEGISAMQVAIASLEDSARDNPISQQSGYVGALPSFPLSPQISQPTPLPSPTTINYNGNDLKRWQRDSDLVFHDVAQGSDDWHSLRRDNLTASMIGSALGSNSHQSLEEAILQKVGGGLFESRGSSDTDRGHRLEDVARKIYEQREGVSVEETGFITNRNYPGLGVSPDGLVGDNGLLEIKAPRRIFNPKDRQEYVDQVQMQMHVTGRDWADLMQIRQYKDYEPEYQIDRIHKDPNWYTNNKGKIDAAQAQYQSAINQMDGGQAGTQLALLTEAVKQGTLEADDAREQRRIGYGGDADFAPYDDEDAEFGPYRSGLRGIRRPSFGRSGGGSGGRGGGGGNDGGSWWGNPNGALGDLYRGISSGSLAGLGSGMRDALSQMGPIGGTINAAIGVGLVGNEVVDSLNEEAGSAADSGFSNPFQFTASRHGLEEMGLNSGQAAQTTESVGMANALLEAGDPSAASRIIVGSRGLISLADIRAYHGNPEALIALVARRAKHRGDSPEKYAGLMALAGLPAARAYTNSDSLTRDVLLRAKEASNKDPSNFLSSLDSDRQVTHGTYDPNYMLLGFGEDHLQDANSAKDFVDNASTAINANIVKYLESGGRSYDEHGGIITNGRSGAAGSMQVMHKTLTDPGYGVTPAKNKSPEELARVGRDYLAAMHKLYPDDIDKALASYNWGPGHVKQAVDQAAKDHITDWLSYAPKETQNYIKNYHVLEDNERRLNNLNSYTTGGNASSFATSMGMPYGANNPLKVEVDVEIKGDKAHTSVKQNGKVVKEKVTLVNRSNQSQSVS